MQQFARDALLPGTVLWLLGYPGFIKITLFPGF